MKQSVIEANGVVLKEITEADLELVRQWRNDPLIARNMLTQQHITEEQQQSWFRSISGTIDQQNFLIFYKKHAVGVTNIKGSTYLPIETQGQLETGLYIGEEHFRGSFLAFCPALTLHDYCFFQLSCHKLTATVLTHNQAALRFNQSLGYSENHHVSCCVDTITMELTKENYQQASQRIRRLIR